MYIILFVVRSVYYSAYFHDVCHVQHFTVKIDRMIVITEKILNNRNRKQHLAAAKRVASANSMSSQNLACDSRPVVYV